MGSLSEVTVVPKINGVSKVTTAWGLCLRLLWSLRLMEFPSKVTTTRGSA